MKRSNYKADCFEIGAETRRTERDWVMKNEKASDGTWEVDDKRKGGEGTQE